MMTENNRILIPVGSDLNDYTETGYYCLESANNYNNIPLGHGFDSFFSRLDIVKQFRSDRPFIEQRLTFKNNFITFTREWDGNDWSLWIQHLNTNNALNFFYPIGSVYISYEPTHPGELFGGGWVEIKGVFPYFNSGIEKGGSNTHTLTVAEMPSHNHSFNNDFQIWGTKIEKGIIEAGADLNGSGKEYGATSETSEWIKTTDYTGEGNEHNNMPAYQTFYAWRRVK